MLTTPWLLLVVCCKAASRSRPPSAGAVLFTCFLLAAVYTCAGLLWVIRGCPEPVLVRGQIAPGKYWGWRFPGEYHADLLDVLWELARPYPRVWENEA